MDYKELIERLKCPRIYECPFDYIKSCKECQKELNKDIATAITDLLARAEAAEARAKRLEKERDAGIRDLYIAKCCDTCGNQYTDNCILEHCMDACNTIQGENTSYIWRGI